MLTNPQSDHMELPGRAQLDVCFCFKNNGNLKQETAMIIFLKDLSVCGRYETVKVLRL